jgi:hypothetical protein
LPDDVQIFASGEAKICHQVAGQPLIKQALRDRMVTGFETGSGAQCA